MLEVKTVETRRQKRDFVYFPLSLYGKNPNFAPPLYMDEIKIFGRKQTYAATCDTEFFIAYRDSKPVGRIQGICQRVSNEKTGEKRVRFTRFDCVDDLEVARTLFDKLEDWARSLSMDTVCGPLGYSDLEREGLLIEGFDVPCTFVEQYNAPYYQKLIEALGYQKEQDWLERKLFQPKEVREKLDRVANYLMQRNHLHYVKIESSAQFCRDFFDEALRLMDDAYDKLYQTVSLLKEPQMKKDLIAGFKLMIDPRFLQVIANEEGKIVCLSLALPALHEALACSGGHLTPRVLLKRLRVIKKPKKLDLALVGVAREYRAKGLGALMIRDVTRMMIEENIECAETSLCMEDNLEIQNLWSHFEGITQKRRRAFVKRL